MQHTFLNLVWAAVASWSLAPIYISTPAVAGMAPTEERARIIFRDPASIEAVGDFLNIDIFWCSGDGNEAARVLEASELGSTYSTAAKLLMINPIVKIGEIRSRQVDISVLKKTLDPIEFIKVTDHPILRYNPGSLPAAEFLKAITASTINPIEISVVPPTAQDAYMPNYISIYTCSDFDNSAVFGRLYFQVKEAEQKESATEAALALQNRYSGLSVASAIEVVGSKAPDISEVRYFHPDDQKAAEKLAIDLSSEFQMATNPKFISGFETRVRTGTFEAWIAK